MPRYAVLAGKAKCVNVIKVFIKNKNAEIAQLVERSPEEG